MPLSRILPAALLLAGLALPAHAAPIWTGSSIFSLQLTSGVADLTSPQVANYRVATSHPEMGLQLRYDYFISDETAWNLAGGIGFYRETDTPAATAPANAADIHRTESSWQITLGIDRVAHLTTQYHLFAGPAIQLWSGRAKVSPAAFGGPFPGPAFPGAASTQVDDAVRLSIIARIGVHLRLGDTWGGYGQIGHYWGWASAAEGGGDQHWWPSGANAAIGVAWHWGRSDEESRRWRRTS